MDKKKIALLLLILILLILLIFVSHSIFNRITLKTNFEKSYLPFASKNQSKIFEIKKILFFSNSNAENKTISTTNYTLENIYQYTDIALFISSPTKDKSSENTLKKVYITNICYNKVPTLRNSKFIL